MEKRYEAVVVGHLPSEVQSGRIDLKLQRDHEHRPFMRVLTPASERAAADAVSQLQRRGWKKLVRKAPKPSATHF